MSGEGAIYGYREPIIPRHDFDSHRFLCQLVTEGCPDASFDGDHLPSLDDVRQQLSTSYQILNIKGTSLHTSLLAQGISSDFLKLAAAGNRGFFNFFKSWAGTQLNQSLDAWQISPLVVDSLMMLRDRRKYSVSPWTGTMVSTRDSLGPGWYLFRDPQQGFIVGQIYSPAVPCHDTVWIVPGIKTIFFVDMGFDCSQVVYACSNVTIQLVTRIDQVVAYLKSTERRVAVCDWRCDHFGHYVWNVVSAWGALFESAGAESLSTVLCSNTDKFWGRISDIFDAGHHNLEEISISKENQVYDLLFSNRWLLSSINAHNITSSTADRIVRYSMNRCNRSFKKRLIALTKEHWPVVLFSLRFENRAWVDQVPGFAEIALRLREDFPKIAFVIHGLSKGVAMGSTTSWMSLDVELQASVDLEQALGDPTNVMNAVGLSIHESVAISSMCDAFVAPVGSGMALYKWLTNKPGVAFSNTHCLNPASPDRWALTVFDAHRDDLVPSKTVPLSAVTDVEQARHGSSLRANFTLDRSVLHKTIRDLLLSLPRRTIPAALGTA